MNELNKPYDEKMKKTVDVVVSDFASVRAGRANAAVLDKIAVDYYGTPTPNNQVATNSAPDPPPVLPPAHRGAPPGADQAGPQVRRGGQGGHPQHPPGRDG